MIHAPLHLRDLIGQKSILVTSHFDDSKIKGRSAAINLSILPKSLLRLAPVVLKNDLPRERWDAVVIDDDLLVHNCWTTAAEIEDKKVKSFFDIEDFLIGNETLSEDLPIFVDSELANDVRGEDASRLIYKEGFQNLYISTRKTQELVNHPPWIKEILGKTPVWK